MNANMWVEVASAAINYIVVSTISSANQKQTVTDLKTDLRTTKEDLMAELKVTRETVVEQVKNSTTEEIELMKGDKNGQ